MVAEAAVNAEATVLLVGEGARADALAQRLPRAGLEIDRVGTDEVAQVARVTAPDLIVVAGDSMKDGGKRVLALLASDSSLGQLPVLVIRDSFGSHSPTSSDARVAELAQGSAPSLCARWIHALLRAIEQHGLDGRTLQQTLDAVIDASKPSAQSRARPAPAAAEPRSGEIARAPTLIGLAPHINAVTPPRTASRRPSPASESQPAHTTTSLSAFAAAAADQPIATTLPRERQSIPPAFRQASTRPPRASPAAMAKPWRRMPRVARVAAAVALIGFAAVAVAIIIRSRSGAVTTASTGSLSTAVTSGTRTAARAPSDAELGRAEPAEGHDAPEQVRPGRQQAIALANRYVDDAHRLLKRKNLPAARAAYLKALRAFPEYPRALAGIVRVQLQRKDGAEAVRWAKRLVAVQPKRGNNRLLLGDAWALHGDQALARDAWRRAANYGNATARQRLRQAAPRVRRPRGTF